MIGNMDQFINKGYGNDSYKGGATTRHIASGVTQTITPKPNQRFVIFDLSRINDSEEGRSDWYLKSGDEFIYQIGEVDLVSSHRVGFHIGGGRVLGVGAHERVKLGLNKSIEIYNGSGAHIALSYYSEGIS